MAEPKISVLIPLYNRKHYISECIDSVLRQTFQDFEIIIRDNCSTDGSYEFVKEKYATEISDGKIKLIRNFKNLGEHPSIGRLFIDACGEYCNILHSDDMLVPQALEYLYDVAQNTNADVVHSSFKYTFHGDFDENTEIKFVGIDGVAVDKISIIPSDQILRLLEWYDRRTFIDTQYNLFRREFLTENGIVYPLLFGEADICTLSWIMKAKIFVKVPVAFYIYRDAAPDSMSNNSKKIDPQSVAKAVSTLIERSRNLDKLLPDVELFKNESFRSCAKIWILHLLEWWFISRKNAHKDNFSPELYEAIESVFKKHFGDNAEYPLFLFNLLHFSQCNKNILQSMLDNAITSTKNMNISPPPLHVHES